MGRSDVYMKVLGFIILFKSVNLRVAYRRASGDGCTERAWHIHTALGGAGGGGGLAG